MMTAVAAIIAGVAATVSAALLACVGLVRSQSTRLHRAHMDGIAATRETSGLRADLTILQRGYDGAISTNERLRAAIDAQARSLQNAREAMVHAIADGGIDSAGSAVHYIDEQLRLAYEGLAAAAAAPAGDDAVSPAAAAAGNVPPKD